MLILLDIGNTAATYGVYHGGRFLQTGSCLYNDIPKLADFCSQNGVDTKSISFVVSSVVPKITQKIALSLRKKGCQLWIAGANLPVPVKHRYPKSQKPGIDRLVCLYGAMKLYKAPVLVIDFGTAITFDYLSKKGVFEGGMIVPGPELSFQALIQRAALISKTLQLPRKTSSFLGRNTMECLSSGVLEGYGAMTDGLIERFKAQYGRGLKVIATGGFAGHLKPYSRHLKTVDPVLSIKSLLLLYKDHLA
jgi:type III pantothenate kinase